MAPPRSVKLSSRTRRLLAIHCAPFFCVIPSEVEGCAVISGRPHPTSRIGKTKRRSNQILIPYCSVLSVSSGKTAPSISVPLCLCGERIEPFRGNARPSHPREVEGPAVHRAGRPHPTSILSNLRAEIPKLFSSVLSVSSVVKQAFLSRCLCVSVVIGST